MGHLALPTLHTPPLHPAVQIIPSGDSCLVIEVARLFSLEANRQAAAIARQLSAARHRGALPGVTDVVPAMVTVGVHYDLAAVECAAGELPYQALSRQLLAVLGPAGPAQPAPAAREQRIPVCYGGEYGPDLDAVASACGLAPHEVIAHHTAQAVDVLMLGFAPGHAYLGQFAAQLSIPRRSVPRTQVPEGSVGLANRQSVLYPSVLPGGWHVIGRTPLPLFELANPQPCRLQAGDSVRFVAISPAEFRALQRRPL